MNTLKNSEMELENPERREAAWRHAMDVLMTPIFPSLGTMVHNCQVIERILMEYESLPHRHDDGSIQMVNSQEIIALSDYWILGFYEILRIIRNKEYREQAEFPFDKDLSAIFEKASDVRIAFAKLEVHGNRGTNIMPSHSGFSISEGLTYSVYNKQGENTHVNRRQLADEFLVHMSRCQKSHQWKQFLAVCDREGSWHLGEDSNVHEMLAWRIAGVIANKDLWGLNSAGHQSLTKRLDQELKEALEKAQTECRVGVSQWDPDQLAKRLSNKLAIKPPFPDRSFTRF